MKCFIGIDGGGTKTLLRVTDIQKKELFTIQGGVTNCCAVAHEIAEKNLCEIFRLCKERLGSNGEIVAVCMGAAGAAAPENAKFFAEILSRLTRCGYIQVETDAYVAMTAMLQNRPGISVTAGTGSICCGQNKQGQFVRVGGWGHLVSDEGSAYQIALAILRAVFCAEDGRAPKTKMREMVFRHLQCKTLGDVIAKIYDSACGKKDIAQMAYIAEKAAELDDPSAQQILEQAASDIFLLSCAAIEQLNLQEQVFYVATNGGVLQNSLAIFKRFQSKLQSRYPLCQFIACERDAAWGGIDLAANLYQRSHKGKS